MSIREREGQEILRGEIACKRCGNDYIIEDGIPTLEEKPPKNIQFCDGCKRQVEAVREPWSSFVGLRGEIVLCPNCGRAIKELKYEELSPEERSYISKKFIEEDFARTAFMYEWGRLIVPSIVYGFSYQGLARITAKMASSGGGEIFLDVATGTGLVARELSRTVGPRGQIFGIDIALEMLKLGKRKAERRGLKNITFLNGDAEGLPFKDKTFDGLTCQASLNLFPQPEKALAEMSRVLKDDSKLLVSIVCYPPRPNPLMRAFFYVSERVGHRVRFFNSDEVAEMLKKHNFKAIGVRWYGAVMLVEAKKVAAPRLFSDEAPLLQTPEV